jgi:GT2 family glycosyltransferase
MAQVIERPRREREPDEAKLPRILAIVVTHAGRKWLTSSLVALNLQSYPFLDVLVVDDASPVEEGAPALKRIAKRHLRRRRWGFLKTPRPLGFGGAINWAMSRVKVNADLLLFIHDDAELTPDSVERMVARLRSDESTAIVGPKIVSWDDPTRLEEIGMAADRFGYPYKGLEADEIDLGQHDVSQEVFYVTSTCMLVRHDVFRQLKGWDARMRAFSEDLDLCWRARLLGHTVKVEPLAKARHAIAMAKGERPSRFTPARYFIRRNRFRAVMKNVSAPRLVGLIPQILILTFVEMIGFIVLRQPSEILNLLRALGWNSLHGFQTLTERRRTQRDRKVPDRRMRRLMVRESTRVRAYVGNQADRLEEAWGRLAATIAARRDAFRAAGSRTIGAIIAIAVVAMICVLLAFRHHLWGPPAAVGELLPYPERATALLRAWASPWQGVGLGQPGPAPPALALFGLVPLVTFGAAGAAQKLLVIGLGFIALIGGYQLISDVADRRSRLVAGFAYALGAVGYAGVRDGDLGALVFGAAAPFVLHSLIRLTGWVRPAGWNRNRGIARVALGSAISAALVPGSLLLYLLAAVLLAVFRVELGSPRRSLQGLGLAALGLLVGWALLLPWSWTWFAEGGALRTLMTTNWQLFSANFADDGMASVILGQTPQGPVLFGLALPLLGIVAVLTGEGQRRKLAVALWAIVALCGLIVSVTAAGMLRPLVSTPTEATVLASLAFSGLAGLAVGAFRLDLPRRGLGWVHPLTLLGLAGAAFLAVVGLVPQMWAGEWRPGGRAEAANVAAATEVRSLFDAAREEGQFRALWVGDIWSSGRPTVARPDEDLFITGSRGQILSDLFERNRGPGDEALERVLASIEEGATDRAGRLLGAFNIRFVVLERQSGTHRWLNQRDLALVRDRPNYILLENQDELQRAAVYNEIPVYVRALDEDDATVTSAGPAIERKILNQRAPGSYHSSAASGPGFVFVAESNDPAWRAELAGRSLDRTPADWGNAFQLPAATEGPISVSYPVRIGHVLWLLTAAFAWIVVVGASFSRRRSSEEVGA